MQMQEKEKRREQKCRQKKGTKKIIKSDDETHSLMTAGSEPLQNQNKGNEKTHNCVFHTTELPRADPKKVLF